MEPGRFVVAQKAGDGDVLLKLLPVCANASCTAEASRFSFDEAVGNLGGEGGERGREVDREGVVERGAGRWGSAAWFWRARLEAAGGGGRMKRPQRGH